MCDATAAGTPCARRPLFRVRGSVLASPAIMSEKKKPIDKDMPEFMKTERMPEAAPRCAAGTLLMMDEVFGDAKRPEPIPLQKMISAKIQYGKLIGSSISPVKPQAATSSPAVAKGRAPYRPDREPDIGPPIRNPPVAPPLYIP